VYIYCIKPLYVLTVTLLYYTMTLTSLKLWLFYDLVTCLQHWTLTCWPLYDTNLLTVDLCTVLNSDLLITLTWWPLYDTDMVTFVWPLITFVWHWPLT
jgi:hypothetical protein